ncbi:heavy metal-binding domain-containing protein [Arcanobacterium canis]|uniref:UPF0145 protein P7079_00510 n=1 Tax=Arcanobacterium canis TaxID=999183 RepID=A0ABY8FYC1_9ACTO|nr:heavy metal-binding domain-containing protein [Arcanobacterium canis]WFM83497.1 heavy metal-binding domain-containing protein [Arcanobacterium canis]
MISVTTDSLEGYSIREYKGIVSAEVIQGIHFVKDFAASVRNFFGGRSNSYEGEVLTARFDALAEMEKRAKELGANAIVGVDFGYETLGSNGSMVMVTASGTAVVIE